MAEDWLATKMSAIQDEFDAAMKDASDAFDVQEAAAKKRRDELTADAWADFKGDVGKAVGKYDEASDKATKEWGKAMKKAGDDLMNQWIAWYVYEAAIALAAAERDKALKEAEIKRDDAIKRAEIEYNASHQDALNTRENAENAATETRKKKQAQAAETYRKACMTCKIDERK